MAHNNLGTVLLQKGEVDDAIAQYHETLQMAPEAADADYNLGNAFLQKGEVDAALTHYQRAVSVIPKDPDIQVGLGNALWQKEKPKKQSIITGKHWNYVLTTSPRIIILAPSFCRRAKLTKQFCMVG